MPEESVTYRVDEGIAVVTMHRPERLNALDGEAFARLLAALTRARAEGVQALVLTGGAGAFSAGADLRAVTDSIIEIGADAGLTPLLDTAEQCVRELSSLPCPTIAALEGVAVGAGMGLALACDLRVAGRSARLIAGYLRIGACPDAGVSVHLVRAVGAARALALLLRNRPLRSEEMLALGLVEELVDDGAAEDAARRLAAELAGVSPAALLATRELVGGAAGATLEEGLAAERRHITAIWDTADFHDAVARVLASGRARA